jgi:hypothetical protein
MRVGKKLFPYPVLNSNNFFSGYSNADFSVKYGIEQSDKDILVDVYYEINDTKLKTMVENAIIDMFLIVECSSTVYRKAFKMLNFTFSTKLNIDDFKGLTSISLYGVANSDLHNYNNLSFNEIYKSYDFRILKNHFMLVDDGMTFEVDFDEKNDNKVESIFRVIPIRNSSDEIIQYELDSRKILVQLPDKYYDLYVNSKEHDQLKSIYLSMLLVPVLSGVIEQISTQINQSEYITLDDLKSNYKWLSSIMLKYEEVFATDFTIDIIKDSDSFILSQKLLNFPITESFAKLYELTKGDVDEDEY